MRVTIIPEDGSVCVDGEGYSNLNLSWIEDSVHAIQWYGERGEIERKDPTMGKMTGNEEINSLEPFQLALDAWAEAKQAAAQAATPSSGEILDPSMIPHGVNPLLLAGPLCTQGNTPLPAETPDAG
jgi:hypothetical protein